MTEIKYIDSLNNKNNNILLFISKINELNKIPLLKRINFDFKNKLFLETLKNQRQLEQILVYKNNIEIRLIITLINLSKDNPLEVGSKIFKISSNKIYKDVTFLFSNLINNNSSYVSNLIFGFLIKTYFFDKYKKNKKIVPSNLFIKKPNKNTSNKINYNLNLLNAINFTKDLVSEPANILYPKSYTDRCLDLKIKGLKIKVLDINQMKKLNMRSLLGVAKGSANDPRVVIFEWNLKRTKKPIILIGKGITFDTGGISLKPSNGMEEMITDMGGSAVVVGSMINAALNKSKKSIVGIIGLVENMPDGKSQRPGDIVKSMSGQTIEVINTDAEGRLVLADLLTYVQKKYNPLQMIDLATLTGAIMIALGTHKAGLFSNNDSLANKLISSGKKTSEEIWRLPLGIEYDNEINSPRADIRNIGNSRYGGSIHAAQFIKRFVENNVPWAHLDIAGVSWSMKGGQINSSQLHSPGSTAFGIRLLDNFLNRSK